MQPTITDVAREAGVSPKTVSRVINDEPGVRPSTRERVLAAVEHLGFHPDRSARSLRTGRSDTIGLVVPELDQPFFSALADEVAEQARRHHLAVVLGVTGARGEDEMAFPARHAGLDGILLYWQGATVQQVSGLARTVPLVLLGEAEHPDADRVTMDNEGGIDQVVAHLVALGRTRVAVIGVPPTSGPTHAAGRRRAAAFHAAAARHGLAVDPALLVPSIEWRRPDGARATRELIARDAPFDAVVALNDGLALGCVSALGEAGMRVPDDVAVTGFDNLEETQFGFPSVTTVAPRLPGYAADAVDLLCARIEEPDRPTRTLTQAVALVPRDSTIGGGPSWRAA